MGNRSGKYVFAIIVLLAYRLSALASAEMDTILGAIGARAVEIARLYGSNVVDESQAVGLQRYLGIPTCADYRKIASIGIDVSRIVLPDPGFGVPSSSGYIEEPAVVDLLVRIVEGDCGEDIGVRQWLFRVLEFEARDVDLGRVAERVRSVCSRYKDCGMRLRARIGDRSLLLAEAEVPREIRARLGDEAAGADLIGEFEGESDGQKLCELAPRLGVFGNRAAGLALARRLADGRAFEMPGFAAGGRRSVRVCVIGALGQIHQDNVLFTVYYRRIRNMERSGPGLGGAGAARRYVEEVYRFARERYGLELGPVEAEPFLSERAIRQAPRHDL